VDVVLAFCAAVCFGLGTVLQQRGTLETGSGPGESSFLLQILHKPIWLAGALLQASGWVLQAAALDTGSLVVVQSITTLSLVIALPFGALLTRQQITVKVMAGAAAVVAGIVLFLSVGEPSGGTTHPAAASWWSAILVTAALVATFALLGRTRHGSARALLFGAAAGFCFGLQVAVTKVFVTLIGHGLTTILTSWTIYVLVLSAVGGFVLQQSALKTGVLAPAMASANAVSLFAGVLLGVKVFDETLGGGSGHVAPAYVGLVLAMIGIGLLASAHAPDDADAPRGSSDALAPEAGTQASADAAGP